MKFEIIDTYLYGVSDNYDISNSDLFIFDLDHTLIKSASGRIFSKTPDDFIFCENVNRKLNKIKNNIIIITNQGGIKDKKDKLEFFKSKIELFEKQADFEFEIYCAIYDDIYRKPNPTFYHIIKSKYTFEKSIYVGDACGREDDFSSSDYYFYLNSKIDKFYTPENFFLNNKTKLSSKKQYQKDIFSYFKNKQYKFQLNKDNKKEIILMIGLPGSGKSYITKIINSYFEKLDDKYIQLNYTSMTKKNFEAKIKKSIDNNYHIIINGINPTISRDKIIDLFSDVEGYYKRCMFFDKSLNLIIHNNKVRYYEKLLNNENIKKIPDYVLRNMFNKLIEPNKCDFDIIEKIKYNFCDKRKLYLTDLNKYN
jgi:DNA 3'-phosphatase